MYCVNLLAVFIFFFGRTSTSEFSEFSEGRSLSDSFKDLDKKVRQDFEAESDPDLPFLDDVLAVLQQFIDNQDSRPVYLKSFGSEFLKYIKEADEFDEEFDKDSEYTVLVPGDEAFRKYYPIDWGFNPFYVKTWIRELLLNHFIKGTVDINTGGEYKTVGGKTIKFTKKERPEITTVFVDDSIVLGNYPVSKGIIYYIDELIGVDSSVIMELWDRNKDKETAPLLGSPWPESQFASHLNDRLQEKAETQNYAKYMNLSNTLGDLLPGHVGDGLGKELQPYTAFIPIDSAFHSVIPADAPDPFYDEEMRNKLFKNSFVKGYLYEEDLTDGKEFTTLGGEKITIKRDGDKIQVNDAEIVAQQEYVYNLGNVYLIDRTLGITQDDVSDAISRLYNEEQQFGNLQLAPEVEEEKVVVPTTSAFLRGVDKELEGRDEYQDFRRYLTLTNIDNMLAESGVSEFTVLVPTDSSIFIMLLQDAPNPFVVNIPFLRKFLSNSIIKGKVDLAEVKNQKTYDTIGGRKAIFRKNENKFSVNDIEVQPTVVTIEGHGHILFVDRPMFVTYQDISTAVQELPSSHFTNPFAPPEIIIPEAPNIEIAGGSLVQPPNIIQFPEDEEDTEMDMDKYGALTNIITKLKGSQGYSRMARYLELSYNEIGEFIKDKSTAAFFVPRDSAFYSLLPADVADPFVTNSELRRKLILSHFLNLNIGPSNTITEVDNLAGDTFNITDVNGEMFIGDAKVVESFDGLIFIDKVLGVTREEVLKEIMSGDNRPFHSPQTLQTYPLSPFFIDIASKFTGHPRYSVFVNVLQLSAKQGLVSTNPGPFSIMLAPNEAFADFGNAAGTPLIDDDSIRNKMLFSHIIQGRVTDDNDQYKDLLGNTIKVERNAGKLTLNGAEISSISGNIVYVDRIVGVTKKEVLDRIKEQVIYNENVAVNLQHYLVKWSDELRERTGYTIFGRLLAQAAKEDSITVNAEPPFSVLVPNNFAFLRLIPADAPNPFVTNDALRRKLLVNHIIKGTVKDDTDEYMNLQANNLKVETDSEGQKSIGGAPIKDQEEGIVFVEKVLGVTPDEVLAAIKNIPCQGPFCGPRPTPVHPPILQVQHSVVPFLEKVLKEVEEDGHFFIRSHIRKAIESGFVVNKVASERMMLIPSDSAFDRLVPQDVADPFITDKNLRNKMLGEQILTRDLPEDFTGTKRIESLNGNQITVRRDTKEGKLLINGQEVKKRVGNLLYVDRVFGITPDEAIDALSGSSIQEEFSIVPFLQTITDEISHDNDYSQFARHLRKSIQEDILTTFSEELTMIIPSNNAFTTFVPQDAPDVFLLDTQLRRKMVASHIVKGKIDSDFQGKKVFVTVQGNEVTAERKDGKLYINGQPIDGQKPNIIFINQLLNIQRAEVETALNKIPPGQLTNGAQPFSFAPGARHVDEDHDHVEAHEGGHGGIKAEAILNTTEDNSILAIHVTTLTDRINKVITVLDKKPEYSLYSNYLKASIKNEMLAPTFYLTYIVPSNTAIRKVLPEDLERDPFIVEPQLLQNLILNHILLAKIQEPEDRTVDNLLGYEIKLKSDEEGVLHIDGIEVESTEGNILFVEMVHGITREDLETHEKHEAPEGVTGDIKVSHNNPVVTSLNDFLLEVVDKIALKPEYSMFARHLTLSAKTEFLSPTNGPYSILVPSNRAFVHLIPADAPDPFVLDEHLRNVLITHHLVSDSINRDGSYRNFHNDEIKVVSDGEERKINEATEKDKDISVRSGGKVVFIDKVLFMSMDTVLNTLRKHVKPAESRELPPPVMMLNSQRGSRANLNTEVSNVESRGFNGQFHTSNLLFYPRVRVQNQHN